MTRNPIINALGGLLYIVSVVSLIYFAPHNANTEDSIFLPIAMLSLFVFSAASTGYIFLYQPLQLFLEGEKKQAIDLFLKTLVAFAVCAGVLVSIGVYLTASL